MDYILIFYLTTNALVSHQPPPEMAKQYVVEILSKPEFTTKREEYRLRYVGNSIPDEIENFSAPLNFGKLIAQLAEILLWLVVLFAIVVIIHSSNILQRRPRLFKPIGAKYSTTLVEDKIVKPICVNVSQQAWQLWQAGDTCAAISLLYCSALSVLQKRDALKITDNITENECIKLVKLKQAEKLVDYFTDLTHTWQDIAYAGRQPDADKAKELCEKWQQHFG